MSAGRRGPLLSLAFFALALWLCPGPRAHAQPNRGWPPGFNEPNAERHTIWQRDLSPEQIRQAFARFGKGDNELTKSLEDLIRDQLLKNNPGAKTNPEQVDATIRKLLADKELMSRVTDLAQKHRNQNPNRDPNPNATPRELEQDLERLREAMRRNGAGDPFQVPKADPDRLPKFDPKTFDPKNFDPEEFPHADPKSPPQIDPGSGLPIDPRTARPFDPRTGKPLDPRTGAPPVPKTTAPPEAPPKGPQRLPTDALDPPPPKTDPNPGRPEPPPDPVREFDPDNPLGPPKDTPEKLAKAKAYEAATALWEKNVGPLDNTPAVKRAIYDLVSDPEAMDALTDSKGNNLFDMFTDPGDGDALKGLLEGTDGKGWEWPKLDWKLDWGKTNTNVDFGTSAPKTRWPETGSSRWPDAGSWGGSFAFGGVQVPWALAVVLLAMIAAAVVWWKWEVIVRPGARAARAGAGPGPWPIDPRAISTREDVVKAFEYVSVLICGPAAKTWTHSTIADELTALAATHGGTAMKLARLYELARYAPLDEPPARAELLEARRLVCDLAGMD